MRVINGLMKVDRFHAGMFRPIVRFANSMSGAVNFMIARRFLLVGVCMAGVPSALSYLHDGSFLNALFAVSGVIWTLFVLPRALRIVDAFEHIANGADTLDVPEVYVLALVFGRMWYTTLGLFTLFTLVFSRPSLPTVVDLFHVGLMCAGAYALEELRGRRQSVFARVRGSLRSPKPVLDN